MGKIGFDALSRRELEVLRAVGRGLSTPEIAHELGLSENTVNAYANTAKQKVGAPNRRHAAYMLTAHETSQAIPQEMGYQNQRVVDSPSSDAVPVAHRVEEQRVAYLPPPVPVEVQEARQGNDASGSQQTVRTIAWIAAFLILLLIALGPIAENASKLANIVQPPQ